MTAVVVDPDAVHEFRDRAALERWYRRYHATAGELWIKTHKKGSGLASVTNAEALEVALCWGWIDAIRKSYDADSFLQRYTPRRKASIWSRRNQMLVARLIEQGRMQPEGRAEIDRARADGRWGRAYAGSKTIEFPADLLAAIEAEPTALATFDTLTAQNRFALAFRTLQLKTPEARARKIAGFVEMLRRGETPHPNGKKR